MDLGIKPVGTDLSAEIVWADTALSAQYDQIRQKNRELNELNARFRALGKYRKSLGNFPTLPIVTAEPQKATLAPVSSDRETLEGLGLVSLSQALWRAVGVRK